MELDEMLEDLDKMPFRYHRAKVEACITNGVIDLKKLDTMQQRFFIRDMVRDTQCE